MWSSLFTGPDTECIHPVTMGCISVLTADKDIHDVYAAVDNLCVTWSDLCCALKLLPAEEESIAETYRGNPRRCLREVLLKWLRRSYEIKKYGQPSWQYLVRAVGDPSGGNDRALAETIGNKHASRLK